MMGAGNGDDETSESLDLMAFCCELIVEKMGDKPLAEWRAADYNRLSSQLGKATKVYLSENTLKRIFGHLKTPKRYYPQLATRDALAKFVGYRDWHELELVGPPLLKLRKQQVVAPTKPVVLPAIGSPKKSKRSLWFYLVFLLPVFTVVGYFLLNQKAGKQTIALPKVALVCENRFGEVPHTAVFKLKGATPSQGDFDIDFLEEAMPAKINSNTMVTRFFRNPGVVYATLMYKGVPLDTVAVCLQTTGWVANSLNDTTRSFSINGLEALRPDHIYSAPAQLDSAGLDLSKPFWVGYSKIIPSNINGDNFDFSCKVLLEQSRAGIPCVETTVVILGEKYRHLLKLYRANCVAFSEYKFSENQIVGAKKFLKNLAFDTRNGGEVQIRIKNKHVTVFLNKKEVLQTQYKESIGKVLGLKVVFNGIGQVVSPRIVDLSTKESM